MKRRRREREKERERGRERRRTAREPRKTRLRVIEATLAAVSFLADRDGRKNDRWAATGGGAGGIIDFQQAFDARKGGREKETAKAGRRGERARETGSARGGAAKEAGARTFKSKNERTKLGPGVIGGSRNLLPRRRGVRPAKRR